MRHAVSAAQLAKLHIWYITYIYVHSKIKKLNNAFGSLPQSRAIENGPYRDNVTDYNWEYKEGSDMQTNEVIEHLLHTITNVAFAIQFSDWNWEDPSSNIRLATKEAIDNGIFNISDY